MRVHVRASPNRALGRSLVVGAFPRRPRGRARRRPSSSSSVSSSFQRARGARRRRRSWDDRGAVRGARGETFGRGVRRRARASRTRVVDGDAKLTRETVVRGRWTTRDAWREKPARAQGASGGEARPQRASGSSARSRVRMNWKKTINRTEVRSASSGKMTRRWTRMNFIKTERMTSTTASTRSTRSRF